MTIKLHVDEKRITLSSPQSETLKLKNPVNVIYQSESADIYQGDYQVTPKTYEAVELHTKTKVMRDNVTVHKIPQYEVSNDCGGKTLIMGDEYFG